MLLRISIPRIGLYGSNVRESIMVISQHAQRIPLLSSVALPRALTNTLSPAQNS